jgi:hypothetical protein
MVLLILRVFKMGVEMWVLELSDNTHDDELLKQF